MKSHGTALKYFKYRYLYVLINKLNDTKAQFFAQSHVAQPFLSQKQSPVIHIDYKLLTIFCAAFNQRAWKHFKSAVNNIPTF